MPFYRQTSGNPMYARQQPTAQNFTIPASVGGVNSLDPYIALPPQDCIYTYNLMPAENGMELRKAWREHNTGVGSSFTEVRAIIPFEGVDPANNKLFAATQDGIWDISTDGDTSPSLVQAFSSSADDAGYCNWTEFTTDAAETYLFVACPQNGVFQYDESTGTWARPAFTGNGYPGDGSIAFVALHKQRLWLVEKDSTDAFYSGVASITGGVTKFTFGSKFQYGGRLLGLYNWTLDGGDGVDDYFVALSQGGDVLAYRGSDPSATDWSITGSFFVGEMPMSRRCAVPYAGELFILSTYGLTSLRDLVSGVDAASSPASPAAKINPILRSAVIQGKAQYTWQITTFPGDGFMSILAPWTSENSAIQYNMNLLTKAWGFWDTVPAKCGETWQANYYMGSTDGRVLIYDGVLDGVTLDESNPGYAVEFRSLTAFNAAGDHAGQKRVGLIRPITLQEGETTALYNLRSVYDYDITANAGAAPGDSTSGESSWDVGVWDTAIWGGSESSYSFVEGGSGIGRAFAVAMRGESSSRLLLVGWDVSFNTGGGFL